MNDFTAASWAAIDSNRHLETIIENALLTTFYYQRERHTHHVAIRGEGAAAVGYAQLVTSSSGGRTFDQTAGLFRSQLDSTATAFTSTQLTVLGRDALRVGWEIAP